jgi:hypothetical protein
LGIIFYAKTNPLEYIQKNEANTIKDEYGIHKDTANVLKRRVGQIISGAIDFVTSDDVSNLFDQILEDLRLKRIVIIDFTKISEKSENILINNITRHILNYNKKIVQNEDKNPHDIMIVLEEAQRFLDP